MHCISPTSLNITCMRLVKRTALWLRLTASVEHPMTLWAGMVCWLVPYSVGFATRLLLFRCLIFWRHWLKQWLRHAFTYLKKSNQWILAKNPKKSEAKDSPSDDKPSWGQGQKCSGPRTKGTGASVLKTIQKKVLQKIFLGVLLKKKGLQKIFSGGL